MEVIILIGALTLAFLIGGALGVKVQEDARRHKWKPLGEPTRIFSIVTEKPTGKITRYCCDVCGKIRTFRDEL